MNESASLAFNDLAAGGSSDKVYLPGRWRHWRSGRRSGMLIAFGQFLARTTAQLIFKREESE